jgi:hypothetical protein
MSHAFHFFQDRSIKRLTSYSKEQRSITAVYAVDGRWCLFGGCGHVDKWVTASASQVNPLTPHWRLGSKGLLMLMGELRLAGRGAELRFLS